MMLRLAHLQKKEQELDKLEVPFLKKKKKENRVNAGVSVAGEDLLTHSPIYKPGCDTSPAAHMQNAH